MGGAFIFAKKQAADAPADFHSLVVPYVVLGLIVLLVFGIFWFVRLPDIDADSDPSTPDDHTVHRAPISRQPHFLFGIVTQFFYVAAQIGVNALGSEQTRL